MYIPSTDLGSKPLTRKAQLLELLVFLFLIVPRLALSFLTSGSSIAGVSFLFLAGSIMFSDLSFMCLVLFFVWRNNEHSGALGLTIRHFGTEAGLGVLIFFSLLFFTSDLAGYMQKLGLSAPSNPLPLQMKGPGEYTIAVLMVIVVAIAEEAIFRGYLLLRLEAVTSSQTSAVILSALIFTLGHGYEGTARMVPVFVIGVVYAIVYLWRKNLTATITMHFLQDFTGIVLAQLVKHHF